MVGTHGVTESNMMQYLGIIEQRTIDIISTTFNNEILQMYSTTQPKGQFEGHGKDNKPVLAQPLEKVEIDPPNMDNNPDDKAGEYDEVMTIDKLKSKADNYVKENLNKFIKKPKKTTK